LSHAVIASLDTAVIKHDETTQTATINTLVVQLLFEHKDQPTTHSRSFVPVQTTLACDDRISKDNTAASLSPLQRLTRCLLHLDVDSLRALCVSVALTCGTSSRYTPRHTTAFPGYVDRSQPPPSAVRASSHCYRGEGTSPFCSTIISFSSGAGEACAAASGDAGG